MRELTFFTTNQTKLAHARYIAEGRQIRILGFRQRTYHADYEEPRLESREELLEASYNSARQQLLKAGYSDASRPFILEDTSVRIEALSGSDQEVPGVDIKYWMEGRTFEELDSMLRDAGDMRDVSVRSDVLLHIPSNFRSLWEVEEDYVVFTGVQRGTIVEKEHEFPTNLVYPWLDNRSFNKWFQPAGCSGPLGSLPIAIADNVDFRRKAFDKLFNFLQKRRFLSKPSLRQMKLPLDQKPNIILCGYTCAGKTTSSQHLARAHGYIHVEASDFMHLSYYYRHGYNGPAPIGDFAEEALAEKPTIAAEKVAEYLVANLEEPVVISGFRSPEELVFVEKEMAYYGKHFISRFITADENNRFERLRFRARPGDDLTIEDFSARDLQQARMGLEKIKNMPEVLTLDNNQHISSFLNDIDQLVGEGPGDEINIEASLAAVASISDVGLHDAILIALLSVWKNDEKRDFFTTTEIAVLISSVFSNATPKHKDNVSRYFNQDYYAFFEINSSEERKTRKYRLSNTGFGLAIKTLRKILR